MVVMSTEIGRLAEIEFEDDGTIGPTLHDLSQPVGRGVGGDADRHPAVRGPVAEVVGVCGRGALHVEVALKMIASRFERRPAEQVCRSIEVACGLRSAQHVPVNNAQSARAAAVGC
jgi:hypothetical protein